jgi:hypothetical protein
MKGRRQVKEGFLSLKTIETLIVCVPFRGWMGKTKDSSAFEQGMVVGASVSSTATLQGFFHTQQFPLCIKNGPPPKRHLANLTQLWEALESTWASIPVECLIPCRVHAPMIWGCSEGKRGATQCKLKCMENGVYFYLQKFSPCFFHLEPVDSLDFTHGFLACKGVGIKSRSEYSISVDTTTPSFIPSPPQTNSWWIISILLL